MAASSMRLPTWYRVLAVIVGVMSIVLALIVLVDPVLGVALLILLLALALLFMGFDRLVAGISGHPFGPMFMMSAPPTGGASQIPPSQTPPAKP